MSLMGGFLRKGFITDEEDNIKTKKDNSLFLQSSCNQKKSKSEDTPSYQGWQSRKVERVQVIHGRVEPLRSAIFELPCL